MNGVIIFILILGYTKAPFGLAQETRHMTIILCVPKDSLRVLKPSPGAAQRTTLVSAQRTTLVSAQRRMITMYSLSLLTLKASSGYLQEYLRVPPTEIIEGHTEEPPEKQLKHGSVME